jgi:CheY-like chemotaxis protein
MPDGADTPPGPARPKRAPGCAAPALDAIAAAVEALDGCTLDASEGRRAAELAARLAARAAAVPVADLPMSAPAGDQAAARILVVEDDPPVRAHAERLLRGLGYAVRAAGSGDEALRLLAEEPRCDLLFTDVVMPGMSGGRLAQAARLLVPELPVIFVTGHSADPLVEQLRREGAALLLQKPYRRQHVAQALDRALGRGAEA